MSQFEIPGTIIWTGSAFTTSSVADGYNAGAATISALRAAIPTLANTTILLDGYHSAGDGGGGIFYWDTTSHTGDNGGTIIVPTGSTTGRWARVYSGNINVKWFGAYGDNIHDDTASIQSAINLATSTAIVVDEYVTGGNIVLFPPGTYNISSDLVIPAGLGGGTPNLNPVNIILQGSGRLSTFIQSTVPGVNNFSQQYAQSETVLANILLQDMTLCTSVQISTWAANTTYTVGATVTSGCSPFTLLCTHGGTSGTYAPFGKMSGSGPLIKLSGTPAAQYSQIIISITVGGTLGTAEFQYSTNAGQTFNGTNIPTASSVVLGSTGLTATFSAGTYTESTGLSTAGTYFSGQIGYAFSSYLGDSIQDGTVIWEIVGGSGFLQVDGARVTVSRVDFLNLPVGLIFDGTETSKVDDCNFISLNGIWVTGGGARTHTNSISAPNGFYCSDCSFGCSQINISLTVCEGAEIENVNFEDGICAVWLANCDLVEINTLLSEGISTGIVINQTLPYSGTYVEPSFSITVKNSLINPNAGSSPYGNAFQFAPNVNDTTFQVITPYEHLTLINCQIDTPSSSYAFLGAEAGNGLRLIDTIFNQSQSQWFNNGVANNLIVEESGNAVSGTPQLGIGMIPRTNFDVSGSLSVGSSAAFEFSTMNLSNGSNANVSKVGASAYVSGPSATFSISGLVPSVSSAIDGQDQLIINNTGNTMTINHQNTGSTAANRIICPNGMDLVLPSASGGFSWVKLRYNQGLTRWLVNDSSATSNTIGVANMTALRTVIAPFANTTITLDGYYTAGDGGGGNFYWDTTSSSGDNGGTIIVPTGSSTGRWARVYSGAISVKWFGAYGDGTHYDTTAIQNAINYIGSTVFFPPGTYLVEVPSANGAAITISNYPTILQGSGPDTIIQIQGYTAGPTSGTGILVEPGNNGSNNIQGSQINNMVIEGHSVLPQDLIVIHCSFTTCSNLVLQNSGRFGILVESGTTPGVIGSTISTNGTNLFADNWRVDQIYPQSCGFTGTSSAGYVLTGVPSFTQPSYNGTVTVSVTTTNLGVPGATLPYIALINPTLADQNLYGIYQATILSSSSLELLFIDNGNNSPTNGIIPGNNVPASYLQWGGGLYIVGGDTNAGMANTVFAIDCCFGITDISEGGNNFNKCYVQDSYCAYVLHSNSGGSVFLDCGCEGDSAPFVSCYQSADLVIGGQLCSSAGAPGGRNTCETLGQFGSGFIFGRIDGSGTTHQLTAPSVGQSGGNGPINIKRTPATGTASYYYFTHINHTGLQTPFIDGSYIWQPSNSASPYPVGYLNGPNGWTDFDNVRAGGNAAGCPFTAAPRMNSPQKWTYVQTGINLTSGNNIVYLNGDGYDAGAVPFCDAGTETWPNAQSHATCELQFSSASAMTAAGVCTVNGIVIKNEGGTGQNLIASINVANSCSVSLVWTFELFIQNYPSTNGTIG